VKKIIRLQEGDEVPDGAVLLRAEKESVPSKRRYVGTEEGWFYNTTHYSTPVEMFFYYEVEESIAKFSDD